MTNGLGTGTELLYHTHADRRVLGRRKEGKMYVCERISGHGVLHSSRRPCITNFLF